MKRDGKILLLNCGHCTVLDKALEADCDQCDDPQLAHNTDSEFLRGFAAGLSAQFGVACDYLPQLAHCWLGVCGTFGHLPGCACHVCTIARKIVSAHHGAQVEDKNA